MKNQARACSSLSVPKLVALAAVGVFALATMVSCSSETQSATTAASDAPETLPYDAEPGVAAQGELVIGVSLQNSSRTFFQGLESGARREASSSGAALILTDANDDAETQLTDVQGLINAGVDGIVLSPVDSATAVQIAELAQAANIPIVAVANQIGTVEEFGAQFVYPGTVALVTNDDVDMGRKAANLAARLVGDDFAHIAVLEGKAGTANAVMRHDGFTDELDALGIRYDIVAAVSGDWTNAGGMAACDEFASLDTVDLVFSMSDAMTAGCVDSRLTKGAQAGQDSAVSIISIGGNHAGLELVLTGRVTGTVCQKPATMGALAVETMVDALNEGLYTQGLRFYDTPVVTIDNSASCIAEW